MNASRSFSILLSLLFVATFAACDGGCGGCGDSSKIPSKPIDRVKDVASKLPKNTEAVLFLADLKETRAGLNNMKARMPDGAVIESVQKQFQANFGIDLLDRESWAKAGIAPDSSMGIAIHRSRVIALTYVENRQQFEKTMTEKAKNAFQIKAVTKNEKVGGHTMKVLSDDPAKQVAWMYQGKMALVVMPATSADGALEKGTASLVLSEIAGTEKAASLASTEGFKAFLGEVASEYPATLFLNPTAYVASPEFQKRAEEDPTLAAGAKWSNENLEYGALGFSASKEQVELRGLLGMQPELAKAALEASKAATDVDWSGFATDNLMIGIRFAIDWSKAWKIFTANLPDDERRSMLRNLKQAGQSVNLDLEQDVLQKLTGNAAIFFYGIGGGLSAATNPAALLDKAGLMIAIQFDSAEAVQNLSSKMMSRLAMMASLRPLQVDGETIESWKVIEFTGSQVPGRIFLHKDMVMFATTAFSEKSVFEYATNKRSETRLKDTEALDRGQKFAYDDNFTGIYFNAERARDNLGGLLMMVPEAQILNEIEEASLQLGVNKVGGFASLLIDLEKSEKKDTTGKGAEEAAPAETKEKAGDSKADDSKAGEK